MDMAEKLALEDIRAMTDSRQPEKPTEASRAKIFPLALVAVLLSACYLICFEILFEKVYFFPVVRSRANCIPCRSAWLF